MATINEFFIPNNIEEIVRNGESNIEQYVLDEDDDFNVSESQQLDDITRLFDELQHEKSPTALFTRKEIFAVLFSYIKGMYSTGFPHVSVVRSVRHKICHEISERFKKLLQVTIAYIKKRETSESVKNVALEICVRSTLKMYAFIICHILLTEAPTNTEETTEEVYVTERTANRRRRRREVNSGFADDSSGVDLDGRELALSSLIEIFSSDVIALWEYNRLENNFLHLIFKLCLHMISQKANINNEAQSISSSLALLLTRVSVNMLIHVCNGNTTTIVSPLVELSVKSEHAALFLSNFVADLEQEINNTDDVTITITTENSNNTNDQVTTNQVSESSLEESVSVGANTNLNVTTLHNKILYSLFNQISEIALLDASSDTSFAKNIALFMIEVARKCVSAIAKVACNFSDLIECESYDIRKAVITCIAEIILQRYSLLEHNSNEEVAIRNKYFNELLFRINDINPFVRNHTIHTWERLIESRGVPKRYQIALVDVVVNRIDDRNYLVRDAAMTAISLILKKNWFGHVLDCELLEQKLKETEEEAIIKFSTSDEFNHYLNSARFEFQPTQKFNIESIANNIEGDIVDLNNDDTQEYCLNSLNEEQVGVVNKYLFYENALMFVNKIALAVKYACALLDSRTERDVVEAIKLIVTVTEFHFKNSDAAFLKVLALVFDGEIKIQLTVRDAFAEVIFNSFARLSTSVVTRSSASAQKLVSLLRCATEGDISAVEKIISLLVTHPSSTRYISTHFIDAMWSIAEGSVEIMSSATDRRTAMRIYSMITKYYAKDVHARKDSILQLLQSLTESVDRCDNILISYMFDALQNITGYKEFACLSMSSDPRKHEIVSQVLLHLCRPTNVIESWIRLAASGINFICEFCELPITIYKYVITCTAERVVAGESDNAKAQLFFLIGHTALKQLVSIENLEKTLLKELESSNDCDRENEPSTCLPSKVINKGGINRSAPSDEMRKELGIGSSEYKRHVIQELSLQRRKAILLDEESIWKKFSHLVIEECTRRISNVQEYCFDRVCAVMALCKLMVVSEEFCAEHLHLIFSIVADSKESWVIKTNIIVALGDLACVHPNLLAPFLSSANTGFLKLLNDDDLRVRAAAIQVCSHLVLGEMLRVRDHLYLIVKLVADPDASIAQNALSFVQNLASKEKERSGNLIPPLISQLSNEIPLDKLKTAMHILLEKVDGDKPVDSLIERLCQRFEPYSYRSQKKINLAIMLSFCLAELSYNTERAVRRIMSEVCYHQYRHWLRNETVLTSFKLIVSKARKSGRFAGERRDKSIIEEWEHRMLSDAHCTEKDL